MKAYTVIYKDLKRQTREFCTYAKDSQQAREDAIECIPIIRNNPNLIDQIIKEKEHIGF